VGIGIKVLQVSTVGSTAVSLLLPGSMYLREIGYDISFLYSPDEVSRGILADQGFESHFIPMSRILSMGDATAALRLAGYFRSFRPDIVHTHTSKAGALGRIAAVMVGVPIVVHTIHGFPFIEGQPWLKYVGYAGAERLLAKCTDLLLSQSLEDVSTAQRLGIRSRSGFPVHIGNGIDLTRFDRSRFHGLPEIRASLGLGSWPVITTIGRLTVEKGYLDLIKALATLRDLEWTALLVGPDEGAEAAIRSLVQRLGLAGRVRLLGQRSDIERLLAASDLFVLPSYREGVPRSVIEAQAMCLPVVATDIRGCREVVIDGVSGLLVEAGAPRSLAASMRLLLESEDLRKRMGEGGRRRAEAEFDERRVFQRIGKAYEMVLARKHP
jgi:glycosyltransferase involved in cell wall biosynthesis